MFAFKSVTFAKEQNLLVLFNFKDKLKKVVFR